MSSLPPILKRIEIDPPNANTGGDRNSKFNGGPVNLSNKN